MSDTRGLSPPGRSPFMAQISPNGEISVGNKPQLMEELGHNGELSVGNFDDDNRHVPVAVGNRQHVPLQDDAEQKEPIVDGFGCAMFSPRCSGSNQDEQSDVLSDNGDEDLVQVEVQAQSPGLEHVSLPTTQGDLLSSTQDTSPMAMEATFQTSPSSPQSMALNSEVLSQSKVTTPSMADELAEQPMSNVLLSPTSAVSCGERMNSPRSAVSCAISSGKPLSPTPMATAPDVSLLPTSPTSPAASYTKQIEEINQEVNSPNSPTLSSVSDTTKQSKESNVNSAKSLLCDSSDDDGDDDEEDSIVLMEKRARRAEAKRVAAEKKLAAKKVELAAKKKAKELAAKKAAKTEAKVSEAKQKMKKVSFIEENLAPLSPLSANSCDGDSTQHSELDDDDETITLGTNGEPDSYDMTDGNSEGLLARSKHRYNAGITLKHTKGTPSSRSGATDSQPEMVLMDDESEASIMVLMRYMGCTPVAYGDSTAMPVGARWLDTDTPEGREFLFDGLEDDNSLLSDDESYSTHASHVTQESLQQELKTTSTYREENVEMGIDDLVPMSPKSMNSAVSANSGPTSSISPQNKKVNKEKSNETKKGKKCDKKEAKNSSKKNSKKKPALTVETDCNSPSQGKRKKKQNAEKPSPRDNEGVLAGGGESEEELSDDERPIVSVSFAGEEAGDNEAGNMEEEPPTLKKKLNKATIKELLKNEATAKKSKMTNDAAAETPTSSKSEKKTTAATAKSAVLENSGKDTGSANKALKYNAKASTSTPAVSEQKTPSDNAAQIEKEATNAANVSDEIAVVRCGKGGQKSTQSSLADTPISDKTAKVNASSGVSRNRVHQENIATALLNKNTPSCKKPQAASLDKMLAVSGGEKVALNKKIEHAKMTSPISHPPASTKSSSSRQESLPPPTVRGHIVGSNLASPVAGGLSVSTVSPTGRQLSAALSMSPTEIEATVDENHSWYEKETMPKVKPLAIAAASPTSEAESVSAAAAAMVAAAMAAAEASIDQSKLMSPRNETKPASIVKLEQSPSNRSDKENSVSERSSCVDSAAPFTVDFSSVTTPQAVSTIPAADASLPAVGSSGNDQPNLPNGSPIREVDALLAKTRKWLEQHSENQSQKVATTANSAPSTTPRSSERKVMGNITTKAVLNPKNSGKNLLSAASIVKDSSSKPSSALLMDRLLLAKNTNITNATAKTTTTSIASVLRPASSSSMQGPKKSILEQLGEIQAKQRDIEKKQQSKFQRL